MFKLWANGAQIYETVYLTCGVHLHNRQVSCFLQVTVCIGHNTGQRITDK